MSGLRATEIALGPSSMRSQVSEVSLTPLRRIATPGGDVLHALKAVEAGYAGFGEAYFTTVEKDFVKGWKRHSVMVLNLVVPCGEIQVCTYDEVHSRLRSVRLGPSAPRLYQRLTVPPGHWVAFGGVGNGLNLMLNVASIGHDPAEAVNRPLDSLDWTWATDP